MNRRMLIGVAVAGTLLVGPAPSFAGGGHGGKGGGNTSGPYSLRFYNCANDYTDYGSTGTVNTFTSGTSVDGGKKAVTVDGANCFGANPIASHVYAIGFRNFWDITLDNVTSLKMSTSNPLTQGGSPRISIELYDGTNYTGSNTLFLDPSTCGTPNGNGWTTSDFRSAVGCSFTDSANHTYAGTPGYYDTNSVWVPPVSAWDAMLQSGDHTGDQIYYAYVIADEPTVNRVDRITLNGQTFTN